MEGIDEDCLPRMTCAPAEREEEERKAVLQVSRETLREQGWKTRIGGQWRKVVHKVTEPCRDLIIIVNIRWTMYLCLLAVSD